MATPPCACIAAAGIARGCPLRCRHCLNPQSLKEETPARMVAPAELYEMTRVDALYFRATLGGVTFGGGEPLLYAPFIAAFRQCCGKTWRLTAETSLNVPKDLARAAFAALDEVIVDVKDMDPAIYRAYTGGDNARALLNLRLALETLGAERILARVPRIPGYNTEKDVQKSVAALRKMGATRFDVFTYRLPGVGKAPAPVVKRPRGALDGRR